MGLARGRGKHTAQISADEKAIIEEYDAAVFVVGNFRECVEKHKFKLWQDIQIPVVATCGPEFDSLPACEALVCGIGRKVERMRRAEEIQKLDEVAEKVQSLIELKRKDTDDDPLFVHPAEIKDRLDSMQAIQDNLRPAPVVLHVNGVRAKLPFEEYAAAIADLEVYGRKLGEVTTIIAEPHARQHPHPHQDPQPGGIRGPGQATPVRYRPDLNMVWDLLIAKL